VTDSSLDSFKSRRTLQVGSKTYTYYSLVEAEKNGLPGISRLPASLKVVLENLLRFEDNRTVKAEDIKAVAAWLVDHGKAEHEISFRPARVLMQDFTGVPAVVDLPPCAMPPPSSMPIRKRSIRWFPSISLSTTR
jgi:aconitate hydratase